MQDIKAECIAALQRVSVTETVPTYRARTSLIVIRYYNYMHLAPLSVVDTLKKLREQQEWYMDGKQARLFA